MVNKMVESFTLIKKNGKKKKLEEYIKAYLETSLPITRSRRGITFKERFFFFMLNDISGSHLRAECSPSSRDPTAFS